MGLCNVVPDPMVARSGPSITKRAKPCGSTITRAGVGAASMLTTAGKLLFTGDSSQHLIAYEPANGKILWHAGLGANVSNGPETYLLDEQQYLVVGAGDSLYAFMVEQ
jgi:glucose dehydrogenase